MGCSCESCNTCDVRESGQKHEEKESLWYIGLRFSIAIVAYILAIIFNNIPLYAIAYAVAGYDIIFAAFKNIIKGKLFDENFLMSIATIGAMLIGQYEEGVAVLLFYQAGEFFQELSVKRSRRSITELMDIRPDYANLKTDNGSVRVSPADVKIGDIIIVKPGERVPLDSIVIEGSSAVDTSALTGESVPRDVFPNDEILSGFVCVNGLLTVRVTKEYAESTISKILDLVENSSAKKAVAENFITKFAKIYTPIVTLSAFLLAIVPPIILHTDFSDWIYRALIFLVISCPCALVISVPLSFFGGIGRASKNGILIKGSNYLEALGKVGTVVFDKTGTLTKGTFSISNIYSQNNIDTLKYAAFAESHSSHPIAVSIVKKYGEEINENEISDYTEIAGYGVSAKVFGSNVVVGNEKLMLQNGITPTPSNQTSVHIAVDGIYGGYITISDEIKENSKDAILNLKKLGVKNTVMLTGDNKYIGVAVGNELGIDMVYSSLLPQDKVLKFEELENNSKYNIIYVGDGINDAPVLARADIGIAMGGLGSDAAIEAADVVIMNDDIGKIAEAIKISNFTRKVVIQNIAFALGIKFLVLVLGALGFANMWWAIFADVGVALIAVLNATRLIYQRNYI